MELSAEQRRLVEQPVDLHAMMVVAGPGSGKTRVLCERIVWLLEQGVEARHIAALTFTQQSAFELHRRVHAASQSDVWTGTFHAFASSLLHDYGELWNAPMPIKVIDQTNQIYRIRDVVEDLARWRCDPYIARNLLSVISKRKRLGLTSDEMQYENSREFKASQILAIDVAYCARLRRDGLLDFDDLVSLCNIGLAGDQQSAEIVREKVRWLFIDEFQDVSSEQYAFIKLISPPRDERAHLITVGDPRQSIYRFRGADPQRMRGEFLRDYDPKLVYLNDNFRSVPSVVACANAIQPPKTPRIALSATRQGGQPVYIIGAEDETREAIEIGKLVKRRIDAGDRADSIGVLFGIHRRGELIEQELIGLGIKVRRIQPGGLYEQPAFDAALDMLRLRVDGGPATAQQCRCISAPMLDEIDWLDIGDSADASVDRVTSGACEGDRRRFVAATAVVNESAYVIDSPSLISEANHLLDLQGRLLDPLTVQERDQLLDTLRYLDGRLAAIADALLSAVAAERPIQFAVHDSPDARLAECILRAALPAATNGPVFTVAIDQPLPDGVDGVSLSVISDHTATITYATQAWYLGTRLLATGRQERHTFVVFDVEATSVHIGSAEIIEIAAIRMNGSGGIVGEPFTSFVRPSKLPREVAKLTGIRWIDLADAPPVRDVLAAFRAWLQPGDVLVGHYANEFDLPLINLHAAHQEIGAFGVPCLDTLDLATRFYPEQSHKLEHLAALFGCEKRQAHRALPDVLTTLDVFRHLLALRHQLADIRAFEDALPLVAASILLTKVSIGPDNRTLLNAGARRLRSYPANQLVKIGTGLLGDDWAHCQSHLSTVSRSREEEAWSEFRAEWIDSIRRHVALRAKLTMTELAAYLALSAGSTAPHDDDRVTLMSVHSSKGREWDTVIIAAVESDLFPFGAWKADQEEIEEGARLLYVGMTRAKDRLALFYCLRRGDQAHAPHPLLEILPRETGVVSRHLKRSITPVSIS